MATENQNKTKRESPNKVAPSTATVGPGPPEHKPPNSDTEHTAKKKNKFFERLISSFRSYKFRQLRTDAKVWIEFVALVTVIFYTIYAGRQVKVMNNTLDEIRRQTPEIVKGANAAKSAADTADTTLKLTFRPRVAITDVHPQGTLNDGNQLAASFEVLNSGPIAAKNFKVYRFENISKLTDISRLPYPKEPLRDYPKMLPSNKPIPYGIYGQRRLSPHEIESLGKGQQGLVATFSILVEYEGDFPGIHHAEACILFSLPPDAWWTYCPWTAQMD